MGAHSAVTPGGIPVSGLFVQKSIKSLRNRTEPSSPTK
jgi:hypothetical protein